MVANFAGAAGRLYEGLPPLGGIILTILKGLPIIWRKEHIILGSDLRSHM